MQSLRSKLQIRQALYKNIREFFSQRDVLEVHTPVLSPYACPDPNIEPLTTALNAAGIKRDLYLHSSPEFAMKKLIAAGSGSIFQICSVFRDSDLGRNHHPEFTMLEWYRMGFTYHQLIDEVEMLIKACTSNHITLRDTQRLSYREAFLVTIGLDPLVASVEQCRHCCERLEVSYPDTMSDHVDEWFDLLMTQRVAPTFSNNALTVIYNYPKTQAALATLRYSEKEGATVAERFEVYIGQNELANGFNELIDADEQLARFKRENEQRLVQRQKPIEIDMQLIDALNSEMPVCSGVALGLDRLLLAIHGFNHINEVVLFPIEKD